MNFKKLFLSCFTFIFSLAFISAQSYVRKVEKGQEAWRYLIKASVAFENGDYSEALQNAEIAKKTTKQQSDWETYTLLSIQKKRMVVRAGDMIDDILPVLKNLEFDDAVEIIERRVSEKGKDFFHGKMTEIVEHEDYFSHCPEADYLIGQIYRIEGEFQIAMDYMNQAYSYCKNLSVPDEKYDILYDLADLAFDLDDEDAYEKYLLSVLKDETEFTTSWYMDNVLGLVAKDNEESLERLFVLHRNSNVNCVKALVKLTQFYQSKGENEKALKCASFASIICVTKMEEALKERTIEYKYKNFPVLLNQCSSYPEIIEWGSDNNIWELFYIFADVAAVNGKLVFATTLFKDMAACLKDDYWSKKAYSRIVF